MSATEAKYFRRWCTLSKKNLPQQSTIRQRKEIATDRGANSKGGGSCAAPKKRRAAPKSRPPNTLRHPLLDGRLLSRERQIVEYGESYARPREAHTGNALARDAKVLLHGRRTGRRGLDATQRCAGCVERLDECSTGALDGRAQRRRADAHDRLRLRERRPDRPERRVSEARRHPFRTHGYVVLTRVEARRPGIVRVDTAAPAQSIRVAPAERHAESRIE